MYAGHFAAALGLKAAFPRAPTWGLLVGAGLPDVLCSVFLLAGVERITLDAAHAPGFRLDFIDWSHSLAANAGWATLFALPFLRQGRAVALAIALAVLSHFPLDYAMHAGDLALYPNAAAHVGFGLWVTLPMGSWIIELAVVLAACAAYALRGRAEGSFGHRAAVVAAVLLVLHLSFSPWARAWMLSH